MQVFNKNVLKTIRYLNVYHIFIVNFLINFENIFIDISYLVDKQRTNSEHGMIYVLIYYKNKIQQYKQRW